MASKGSNTVRRVIFAGLGLLCVVLGIIGVFVPGLPTTEFILAASYLFARSSPALGGWLERNRWFGPPLQHFRESGGMPRRSKALTLASMWTGIGISVHLVTTAGVAVLVVALGVVGTVTILFFVRTTAERQPLILS